MAKTRKKSKTATKKPAAPKSLPNSFRLTSAAYLTIKNNFRLLGGITLIYMALNLLFVQGLNGWGVQQLKDSLQQDNDKFSSSLNVFGALVGGSGSTNAESNSIMQFILFVLVSLVVIWTLRSISAKRKVKVKQAFYEASTPLVPFLIILSVLLLQTIPLMIGSLLSNYVLLAGLAVGFLQEALWFTVIALLAGLTVFLISSSWFALYIVTLPEMTPLTALRSAKKLVRGRRWAVIRRLLFLPLLVLVVMLILIIPLIYWVAPLAGVTFFILSSVAFVFAHSYFYTLYRELL